MQIQFKEEQSGTLFSFRANCSFVRLFLLKGGNRKDVPPSYTYCCLWLSPTLNCDGTMFLPKTVIPISIKMLLRQSLTTFKFNFDSNTNTKFLHCKNDAFKCKMRKKA